MPSPKSVPKPKPEPTSAPWHFEAIGTMWQIDVYEPVSAKVMAELKHDIATRIEAFDKNYSRFRPDSLVSAMSKKAGRYKLPADAQPLFDLYQKFYMLSGGAVTPLIGQVLADTGYDAKYSLRPGPTAAPPAWGEVLDYAFPELILKRTALLDLGAAGKGYLVDIVSEIIESRGIKAYCVDAGGDLRYREPAGRPLDVGLEHPDSPALVIGVAHLVNASLCGSAGNRRAWAGFNHIIDPRSQTSPVHIKAVWATAQSTLLADALTTALYFVPAAELLTAYNFEYVMLKADYSLEYSPGFPAEYF